MTKPWNQTVKAAFALVVLMAAAVGSWHFAKMGMDALFLGGEPVGGTRTDVPGVALAYAGEIACLVVGLLCLRVLKTLPKENP